MKKNLFKLSLVLFFVWFFWSAGQAKADGSVTVHLEVETATTTLFNGSVDVSACPEFPGSATTTVNGFCVFAAAGINVEASWGQYGAFITSIGGANQDNNAGIYWAWFHDLNLDDTGINQHLLRTNEHLLFTLAISPLKISTSNSSPFDGSTTTISAMQFNPDVNIFDWVPAANATIDFGWGEATTDINGQADITATSSAPFSVSAVKTNFLSSNILDITPQAAYANITIRNGSAIIFSDTVALPASNAVAMNISPTGATSTVAVSARSLLSALETLDAAQNELAISDLQYYSSFDSFFINCITIAAETNPLCGSWQYILNAVDPGVGTDHALLKNGDAIFLYFGTPRQVSLSTTAATVDVSFTATAQKYDPANNVYTIYTPTANVVIGVTQPNPNDLWNPIEVATSTVDMNGQVVFILDKTGVYNIGMKDVGIQWDSYFPLTTLIVASSSPTNNQTNNQSNGGSVIIPSSGGGSFVAKVDLSKAVDFLTAKQSADGSFSSAWQTDWAAIALVSVNPNSSAAQKIKSYLLTDPNPLGGMNQVSDYARRAMALMSLNINPYSGVKTNYIKKIIDLFDGRQFGDVALYNDDIFALLVLNKAGYGASDEMIKQTVAFIISKQQANGLWDSIDLTAAAVQALTPLSSSANITSALAKAKSFLSGAQKADGGFDDTYATSWVMQAISAMGENASSWQKNNNTPESYLALSQGADGGLEKNSSLEVNRLWSTAYAIPAVSAKSWLNILNSFAKENTTAVKNNQANNSPAAANSTATSTLGKLDLATSMAEILTAASSTVGSLKIRAEEKKAVAEAVKTAKIFVQTTKQLTPKVLGAKIILPKIISNDNKKIEKKSNQAVALKEIALVQDSSMLKNAVKNNSHPAELTTKEKTKAAAKKALYVAGAGTVLAGIILILKLLGFLL